MADKIKIELGEVQKTLLIPLWDRAMEFTREDALIRDQSAHDIVAKLDFDFSSMDDGMQVQSLINFNCSVRAFHLDSMLRQAIASHPDATVINIGAGLDTTFQRVDNGKIFWYDLDLPDSMELRRKLIPESDRNVFIAKSVFDRSWFREIRVRPSKIILMAGGVFVYLPEAELRALFGDLAREFPGCELMFEIYSKLLIWLRKRILRNRKEKSNLRTDFNWGSQSARKIAKWDKRIRVMEEFPFYSRVRYPSDMDEKNLSQIKLMNLLGMMKRVHLKLGQA